MADTFSEIKDIIVDLLGADEGKVNCLLLYTGNQWNGGEH